MINGNDYYRILGVPRNADQALIKSAYKQIATIYHPDSPFYSEILKQHASPKALEAFFKDLTMGYNILLDVEQRAAYDRMLGTKAPAAREESRRRPLKEWDAEKESRTGEVKIFGAYCEYRPQEPLTDAQRTWRRLNEIDPREDIDMRGILEKPGLFGRFLRFLRLRA